MAKECERDSFPTHKERVYLPGQYDVLFSKQHQGEKVKRQDQKCWRDHQSKEDESKGGRVDLPGREFSFGNTSTMCMELQQRRVNLVRSNMRIDGFQ